MTPSSTLKASSNGGALHQGLDLFLLAGPAVSAGLPPR